MSKVRINEQAAGYLELDGAQKDGDCQVVDVAGGVSKDKGCCNNFWPPTANKFTCGTCVYLADESGEYDKEDGKRPISKKEASRMSDTELLDSDRPVIVKAAKE